jgi:TRAP-type mannitol/chloroaromatic compound transport system permease large subunit
VIKSQLSPLTLQGIAMNPILAIFKEHNISDVQINELFQTLTENPFAAMATIGQLGIPAEKLQQLMGMVMQNPALIKEAVEELGLDFSKVEVAKAQLQP